MLFARSHFLGGEDPSLLPKPACIVPWYLDANVAVRSRVPAADDFADSDVEESCFLSFVEVCREDREDEEEEESLSREKSPEGYPLASRSSFVFETFGLRAGRETFFVVFLFVVIIIIISSSSSYSSDCAFDEELSLFVLSRIASNRTWWSPRGDDRLHSRRGGRARTTTTRMFSFVSLPHARQSLTTGVDATAKATLIVVIALVVVCACKSVCLCARACLSLETARVCARVKANASSVLSSSSSRRINFFGKFVWQFLFC